MPSPETELLRTLTLEQLKELRDTFGFKLKATTKKELVPSLSRAIKRKNIPFKTLVKETDRLKHPSQKTKKKKTQEKGRVPMRIRKILRILDVAEVPKTITRETETILQNSVKTALLAKGYSKVLAEKRDTKPVTEFTKTYYPDFWIADKEIGDVAIELKVLRDKGDLPRAFQQARVYRKKYRHVILFLYDAGKRRKPEVPVIVDDGTLRQELEKRLKRNIYVRIKRHSDVEVAMLRKIKRTGKSKKAARLPKVERLLKS